MGCPLTPETDILRATQVRADELYCELHRIVAPSNEEGAKIKTGYHYANATHPAGGAKMSAPMSIIEGDRIFLG
jgi:hypothetical protein